MDQLLSVILLMFVFAAVFAFPAIPAFIAHRKGYSFILFYVFALLCLVPAIIFVMILSDRETGERFGMGTR